MVYGGLLEPPPQETRANTLGGGAWWAVCRGCVGVVWFALCHFQFCPRAMRRVPGGGCPPSLVPQFRARASPLIRGVRPRASP